MDKTLAAIVFGISVATWVIMSTCAPWVLGDNNEFLRAFVGVSFVSFMGVLVSISVASAVNIQLAMNRAEEGARIVVFDRTRSAIGGSTYALLWSLLPTLIIVVVKPLVGSSAIATSFFNGAALLVVLFSVLVLADIVASACGLRALVADDEVGGR